MKTFRYIGNIWLSPSVISNFGNLQQLHSVVSNFKQSCLKLGYME